MSYQKATGSTTIRNDRQSERSVVVEHLFQRTKGATGHRVYPYLYDTDRKRFLDGLRKAGLPEY